MIIKLIDRTEIYIDSEQYEYVDRAIEGGAEWINVDGARIRVSTIASILKGGGHNEHIKAQKVFEDKRVATDEGIAKARVRLYERLSK